MNRSALKKYAPQARLDFIEAVTLRARRLGLDPTLPVSVEQTGDVLLIAGQPFPASVAKQRFELARRIQLQGFNAVVEALAYTWFNRLVAIRFMELKGYLSHGYRVLSHPEGGQPEILEHAQHLDLPGLDKEEVIRLKTAGNQDEALYREILLAQCHELHRNMPFLFEALDDATELLLPDNLLRTDSLIARLVGDIDEGDWHEVEVIGWLYQFYISDKKDEVIGKVVKSEDIPAATQLFTPNWIVQYLVQNSLGRLWLMANPGSSLKEKMPYYIEPAEQTPEVQAQLDALIKVRMDEDGGTLNPESLTVLDPACGSGHILVEAYNLLRAIYEERGYRLRDIPRLILQKNLYGLDIDDRAAQLAGFALLMKAREDDRRLFDEEGNPPHLNVMATQQSIGLPDEEMARVILNAAIQIEGGDAFHSGQLFGGGQLETKHSSGLTTLDLRQLIKFFEHGKTFGSLISVPDTLRARLGKIVDLLASVRSKGDDLSRSYASQVLEQFAWPASLLALQYDAVVANPPYMGGKGMNPALKDFAKKSFPDSKADLFAMFIERGFCWCKPTGFNSMVTMQSWMFLSSYQGMREKLLADRTIHTMAHLGARAFSEISGEVVQTTAFVLQCQHLTGFKPVFFRLVDGTEMEKNAVLLSGQQRFDQVLQDDFKKVPESPIAYWASQVLRDIYATFPSFGSLAMPRQGMASTNNSLFVREWHEVSIDKCEFNARSSDEALASGGKWFPYDKGGEYRKWFGNNESVVNYEYGGKTVCDYIDNTPGARVGSNGRVINRDKYFLEGNTWSAISSGDLSVRYTGFGHVFSNGGMKSFSDPENLLSDLAFLNSKVASVLLSCLSGTLNFDQGLIARLPLIRVDSVKVNTQELISISRKDWNCLERSWDFQRLSIVDDELRSTLSESWLSWDSACKSKIARLSFLENENNRIIIQAYGLQDEISPDVSDSKVFLVQADREKDSQRLVSYAIGCMMGRYSLDAPGLIYANSGGIGFDPARYRKFSADADGIIPITDESWFEDNAAERLREFVKVVWGAETLVENMEWLADSLGRKSGESADEAIRRYLSTSFYKDHLQTYKKRPIYWLFSSGKQDAFQALVYLHRYNGGTLARLRAEYVIPLTGKMHSRIEQLERDVATASSTAVRNRSNKQLESLRKKHQELLIYDEQLRHYADQRIELDLDDGVKVNYGKFGDLLADVKSVVGKQEED